LARVSNVASTRSRYLELDGTRVRYLVEPGPADGPVFVLVHGLGGSLENWSTLVPLLAQRGRVVRLDLGGFGKTRVEPARASVPGNLKLLTHFLRELALGPAVVIGNSMGGLLTLQLAATSPELVSRAVLIDPAVPASPRSRPHPMVLVAFGAYALPGVGQKLLDATAERSVSQQDMVQQMMSLISSHPELVPQSLIQEHLEIAQWRKENMPEADEAFLIAAKSVLWQSNNRKRFHELAIRDIAPTLLLHGDQDKLVNVKAARALAKRYPHWTYVEGADRGHSPMFDFPEWVRDEIFRWLDSL
jgi:pimeloyl-ACP methyl ester carboxylesterase